MKNLGTFLEHLVLMLPFKVFNPLINNGIRVAELEKELDR